MSIPPKDTNESFDAYLSNLPKTEPRQGQEPSPDSLFDETSLRKGEKPLMYEQRSPKEAGNSFTIVGGRVYRAGEVEGGKGSSIKVHNTFGWLRALFGQAVLVKIDGKDAYVNVNSLAQFAIREKSNQKVNYDQMKGKYTLNENAKKNYDRIVNEIILGKTNLVETEQRGAKGLNLEDVIKEVEREIDTEGQ